MTPRAYLAGPDVFLRDPTALAAKKKTLCQKYGFEGVFPLDTELDLASLDRHTAALEISRANEALIRSCQLVIAHLTPFRGPSADVGTAYEMGFGRALGLRVFAYTNTRDDFTVRSRNATTGSRVRPDGSPEDEDGMAIESFGMADNLMLVGAIEDSGGSLTQMTAPHPQRFIALDAFEECLRAAKTAFNL